MNRRDFLQTGAAMVALSGMAPEIFAASGKRNKGRIGIQLYSVRNELNQDLAGTLRKLSDIGYASVEAYGFDGTKFCGKTLKELSAMLSDLGMTLSGTHTGSGLLPADTNAKEWDFWKRVADEVKAGGGKWAIQAWFPGGKTIDELKRVAEQFNRCGEVCKQHGVKFANHNHYDEFKKVDGQVIMDVLLTNTDPKLVGFQFDLGHTEKGGADCVDYITRYKGRIPCWHASDFSRGSDQYTEVGKGSVNYPELFKLANSSGLELLTVEQETGGDIFASCKNDFDYLKQFKWTKA